MFEVGDYVTILPNLRWKSKVGGIYINLEKYRRRGQTKKIVRKYYDAYGKRVYRLEGMGWEDFSEQCFLEYQENKEKIRAARELTEINADELLLLLVV